VALYKRSKVIFSSLNALDATALTVQNYVSGASQPNLTITSSTSDGVLGGSVAAMADDYTVKAGAHNLMPVGLYANDAAGASFENSPATASNKIAIAMGGGEFEVDVFETHAQLTPWASILATYTVGTLLYCSANGLLTTELPTDVDGASADGVDQIIGVVTSAPTASNLVLGLILRI